MATLTLTKKAQVQFMAEQFSIEFRAPTPTLEQVAIKYLGYKAVEEAVRAANSCTLPIPAFRMGSNKSPYVVNVLHLAEHVFNKSQLALQDHTGMKAVA